MTSPVTKAFDERDPAVIAICVLCAENAPEGFSRGEGGLLFGHAPP